jgi:hypothetical protein
MSNTGKVTGVNDDKGDSLVLVSVPIWHPHIVVHKLRFYYYCYFYVWYQINKFSLFLS